jgi:hypothetical protein
MSTKRRSNKDPAPPEPPRVRRFVKLDPLQAVGFPLMLAVTVAGLLGVFGATTARSSTTATPLALHVEYPSRLDYQQSKPLTIEVRNQSRAPIESVSLEIDRAYLEAFSIGSFLPEPDELRPDAYVVRIGDVQAGEVRRVAIEVEGEAIGSRAGEIRVTAGDRPIAAIDVSTFVFP